MPKAKIKQSPIAKLYSKIAELDLKIFGLFAFFVPLTVFVSTTSQSITAFADSAELITAAYNLDIAHPPGYPLYILLGKLFTLIPVSTIAFRINLLSCVSSAAACFLAFKTFEKLGLSPLSSLLASWIIAFSYSFWLYSITAEVYSLNNLFFILLIYLSLLWFEKKSLNLRKASNLIFLLGAFVFGLGLANHLSLLLLVPAILFLVWAAEPKALISKAPASFLLILLGLTPYLLIFYSAGKPHYPVFGLTADANRIFAYITRYDYGGLLSAGPGTSFDLGGAIDLFAFYTKLMFRRFTPLAPILAAYFLLVTAFRKRTTFIFFSLILVTTSLVFPILALRGAEAADFHSQGVIERFSLTAQLTLGIVFLTSLYGLIANQRPHKKDRIFQAFAFTLTLFMLASNLNKVNKKNFLLAQNYALDILSQAEPESIIFTSDDMTLFSLLYFVNAEKLKPEIVLINTDFLENTHYQKELKRRWPDLFDTDSVYSYDVARDIIDDNQGKRPIYFVMLKDPYPLGFDGNPHYLLPQGLLLKADTDTQKQTLEKNSMTDFWEKYDLSQVNKNYEDPFAQLAQHNYLFRAQVNTKIYLQAGCLPCAENDIEAISKFSDDQSQIQDTISSVSKARQDAVQPSPSQLIESAEQNLSRDTSGNLFYFHRAVWDLERAFKLDPENQEAQDLLDQLMASIGL